MLRKKKQEEERTNDAKPLYLMQKAGSNTIFLRILRADTTNEAWEILQQDFYR